jgi:hypothetical protein
MSTFLFFILGTKRVRLGNVDILLQRSIVQVSLKNKFRRPESVM